MGDENHIRTLGDCSKPSHEGYKNTIELPVGNNVAPLRSDTIRLVQNGCSFYQLRSKDPNQHLKDFLKLVDTLDLDGANRERTCLQSWALLEVLALYDNERWNDPRDFAKPVKAIYLPQDVPSTSDHRLIELENQVQRLMEAHLALAQSTQVNKITSSCKIWSDPHDTQYCMENPEQAFVEYAYSHNNESSLAELSKHPSSPKHVHFVNSIFTLNKEDEAKEEGSVKSGATEYRSHKTVDKIEDKVKSEEEVEEETEEETKEEEEGELEHFDTFPTLNELRESYGVKSFVGNFTYEYDFMVLEYTTSVIDHYLGSVVFGKPFVEATRLIYNKEEGTVTFKRDKEKIVFKMPHKMDMFKHIDFTDISTDCIPSFIVKSDDDNCKKTHYSDSLDLGPEYKYDEYVCRGIQSLMVAKAIRKNKGEVT
ncbi:hypothetical protein Tco_0269538 [Tanacetum coccineum]